jgi:hypothetical protein
VNIELDEHEQATLIGLLVEVIETSQLPTSPRLKAAKSILVKLGIASMPAVPYSAPRQSAQPGVVLTKNRRH